MAPTKFNLCTYVVGERWPSRMAEMEDVGSYLRYKFGSNSLGDTPEMPVKISSKSVSLQTM